MPIRWLTCSARPWASSCLHWCRLPLLLTWLLTSATAGTAARRALLHAVRVPTTVLLCRAHRVSQLLGDYGEGVVVRLSCPRCKHERTLRRLPINFRCADVICDFCGYLAQVKATERADVDTLPRSLMGSAWAPQKERMDAGIYFPLFIVVANRDRSAHAAGEPPGGLQPQPAPAAAAQPACTRHVAHTAYFGHTPATSRRHDLISTN